MPVQEALGYSKSSRFIDPDQVDNLPASELTFALRHASSECAKLGQSAGEVRFDGAYVLQDKADSPAVPVVYVVQTKSEAVARQVHQFVWNQNQSPFLVVESPTAIRVYRGFTFDRDKDEPLVSATKDAADILTKLAAFRAESIDDGKIWSEWVDAVQPLQRVDESLLRDLKSLNLRLQSSGVSRRASHGLIGKFVYLRYLRDRDILSNKKLEKWEINPDHVFTEQATLRSLRKVDQELQQWLNGSVFSLGDVELSGISQQQLRLVAGVFQGGSPVGLDSFQPSLFEAYNFAQIPIETLSCVYEQFLHDAKEVDGSSRGKTLGAYYTPLPLADYVLSELERKLPLKPGMKVLDPACGSGAFLVQSYRRLIEKQRRIEGRDLKKSELRELLTKHIFGIDRDDDACRIAELSLILTLLDYVEPPDLEDTNFKLPNLRGQNIFGPSRNVDGEVVPSDFFVESGPVHHLLSTQRFDWIVGNPPWAEVKGTPESDHEHFVAHQWMKAHKVSQPTSGNQIAEAFVWKAGEHLEPDGVCGLVVLAMTWFKKEATAFRQRFFSERRVWCLANFANLAYVLFAGRSERPASAVFFSPERPDDDHVIQTFAPFVAEQIANRPAKPNKQLVTWNIIVGSSDVREIDNTEAARGDSLTWKLAMWGTSRDRKLISRTASRCIDFAQFAAKNKLIAHEGFRLQNKNRKYSRPLVHVPELQNQQRILPEILRGTKSPFSFPESAIDTIPMDECFVPKGRAELALRVSSPPHVLLDAARRYAIFSNRFLVIPAPNVSIAGGLETERLLKLLSLYLSSKFCTYHQFLVSHQWGIDASRAELNALKKLPIPFSAITETELESWSRFYDKAVSFENSRPGSGGQQPVIDELNDRIFTLLRIRSSDRWLVEDFVDLHLDLNKGKVTRETQRRPTPDEQQNYLAALRDVLDAFLSRERPLRHRIELLADRDSAMLSVGAVKSSTAIAPRIHDESESTSKDLATIRDRLRSKHSQWVYFDRALKIYDAKHGILFQFKPLQRLHWTRRQAVLDADEIIAETLMGDTTK
jgi:type I restriction-modification system DNA methylase subunit